MTNIENLTQQLEVLSKIGLDTSTLQQQLDKLQPNEQPVTLDNAQDVGSEPSENERVVDIQETTPPIKAAPAITPSVVYQPVRLLHGLMLLTSFFLFGVHAKK